jgi:peptidoglycan/LPS O-acetylase OafA/YrhL
VSTPGRMLRPDIQALRALAVTLVVAYHAHFLGFGGGYVGVDVFYVISGFLITGLLLRELDETGRIRLGNFFARRARRLLPAACVVLLVTIVASAVLLSPLRMPELGRDAAAAALYVSNLHFAQAATDYMNVGEAPSPFLHFWSLAVEEQFYLVWPALLLLLLRRRGTGDRGQLLVRAAVVVGVVFIASLAASVLLTPTHTNWAFYLSPVRAWEFAAGAAVAVAAGALRRRGAAFAVPVSLLGLGMVLAADVLFDDATAFPGSAALLPVAGATLFIAGGTAGTNPLNRLWALAPLQRLGKLSYALYLWHWPMLVLPAEALGRPLTLVENGLAVLASVLFAEFTMRLVEDPARHSMMLKGSVKGIGFGLVMSLMTAWCVVAVPELVARFTMTSVPAAAATERTADGGAVPVPADLTPALLQAAGDLPASQNDGCNTDKATSGVCQYGDPDAETTVALYGDSHAAQWLPALQVLAEQHGWNVLAMTKSGCPAASVSVFKFETGSPYTACDEWREHAFDRIAAADPAVILVSQVQTYLPMDGDEAKAPGWWAAGLTETLSHLTPVAPTVLLADTPLPGSNVPDCLAEHMGDSRACDVPVSVGYAIDRRAADQVTAAASGAHFADLSSEICDAEVCPAVRGSYLVFRDASHLSTPFAASLAPQLATVLQTAAAAPR